jgi:gamma-glutamylputrescine oxidase
MISPALGENYYRFSSDQTQHYSALQGNQQSRICIIGGGFAGLNTALGLVERGIKDVTLIEAKDIGHGASGRNGGFVFAGFSRGPADLLKDLGPEKAKSFYLSTVAAVELIRHRISKYAIDCDAVESGVYWANWFKDPAVLLAQQNLLEKYFDTHWQFVPKNTLRDSIKSDRYHDALYEKNAMHFHPLKYAHGIAQAIVHAGAKIHEHTPAIRLEKMPTGWKIHTPQGVIEAEQVVLCCGGYLANLIQRVDAAILPIATYVMVTEPLNEKMSSILNTRAAIYDTRFAFDYYRPMRDSRLLWGGRISVLDRSPHSVKRLLQRDMLKVFPHLGDVQIEFAWSGLMSYARHEMPQLGKIDHGLWLAQAFGGHGVAPTTLAGEVLASAIAQSDDRWQAYEAYEAYGLAPTHKPFGFAAAQLSYWWLQIKDAWKARTG